MAALALLPTVSVLLPLALPIRQHSQVMVPTRLPGSESTTRIRVKCLSGTKFCSSSRTCSNIFRVSSFGASRSDLVSQRLVSRSRSTMTRPVAHRHGIVSRATERVNDYSHCKNNSIEGAMMGIMEDVIQHCFKDECDGMRERVFEQMGSGLAALVRVSMSVAAESSPAPIPNKRDIADITMEDLEQVRRMLQLTSLPFHNTYDEDLQRLTNMLRRGEGQDQTRLTGDELSQIFERLVSDLVECIAPLAMCFPKLPLYAQQRALLMPAEVVGKMALSLIAGPKRR